MVQAEKYQYKQIDRSYIKLIMLTMFTMFNQMEKTFYKNIFGYSLLKNEQG